VSAINNVPHGYTLRATLPAFARPVGCAIEKMLRSFRSGADGALISIYCPRSAPLDMCASRSPVWGLRDFDNRPVCAFQRNGDICLTAHPPRLAKAGNSAVRRQSRHVVICAELETSAQNWRLLRRTGDFCAELETSAQNCRLLCRNSRVLAGMPAKLPHVCGPNHWRQATMLKPAPQKMTPERFREGEIM